MLTEWEKTDVDTDIDRYLKLLRDFAINQSD